MAIKQAKTFRWQCFLFLIHQSRLKVSDPIQQSGPRASSRAQGADPEMTGLRYHQKASDRARPLPPQVTVNPNGLLNSLDMSLCFEPKRGAAPSLLPSVWWECACLPWNLALRRHTAVRTPSPPSRTETQAHRWLRPPSPVVLSEWRSLSVLPQRQWGSCSDFTLFTNKLFHFLDFWFTPLPSANSVTVCPLFGQKCIEGLWWGAKKWGQLTGGRLYMLFSTGWFDWVLFAAF